MPPWFIFLRQWQSFADGSASKSLAFAASMITGAGLLFKEIVVWFCFIVEPHSSPWQNTYVSQILPKLQIKFESAMRDGFSHVVKKKRFLHTGEKIELSGVLGNLVSSIIFEHFTFHFWQLLYYMGLFCHFISDWLVMQSDMCSRTKQVTAPVSCYVFSPLKPRRCHLRDLSTL